MPRSEDNNDVQAHYLHVPADANDFEDASSSIGDAAAGAGGRSRRRIMSLATKGLGSDEINMSFANWSLSDNSEWTCTACTYLNDNPRHLACAACGTTRKTNSKHPPPALDVALEDVDEEKADEDHYQDNSQRGANSYDDSDCETAILDERLKEHIAMQQEMLDEIHQEQGENERKMLELADYHRRILDKIRRENAERDKVVKSCPAQQDDKDATEDGRTKITIQPNNCTERQIVEDYRRHLVDQKSTLEESARHLESLRRGLVKTKGSGKSDSLFRSETGGSQNGQERSKEDKNTGFEGINEEWIIRERQLRGLRNQMKTRLRQEENVLRNAAA